MPLSKTVLSPPPPAGASAITASILREQLRLIEQQVSVIEHHEEQERVEKDLFTNLAVFHSALGAAMLSKDINVRRLLINTVADFAETLQNLMGQGTEEDVEREDRMEEDQPEDPVDEAQARVHRAPAPKRRRVVFEEPDDDLDETYQEGPEMIESQEEYARGLSVEDMKAEGIEIRPTVTSTQSSPWDWSRWKAREIAKNGMVFTGADQCAVCQNPKRGIFNQCYRLHVGATCANCRWGRRRCEPSVPRAEHEEGQGGNQQPEEPTV